MDQEKDWRILSAGLADMSRDLLAQDSVEGTLNQIAEHAVTLVQGCDAAGIMVVSRSEVTTLAATDHVVHASDRLQGELGEGPCFDATTQKQRAYRIEDMSASSTRWPRYAPAARDVGVGSMMGFLLYTTDSDNLGALDMYSASPGAFTERSELAGWVLASHAAVALASARRDANLVIALQTSRSIGEAIGITMARYGLTEEAAFERLRTVSQNTNVKLRHLAETVRRIGEIPSEA